MSRITLTAIARRHADAVQRLASHPDGVATPNLPDPYPKDGARTWIEAVLPRHEEGTEMAFAVLCADDTLGGVTGRMHVTDAEERGRRRAEQRLRSVTNGMTGG